MASHYAQVKLNVRFLGRFALIVLALGLGIYLLHRHQQTKLSAAYELQAKSAAETGQPDKEANYLRRYLGLNPSDNAARVRLGRAVMKTARRPNERVDAYMILQDALQQDPSLPKDVRQDCVKLAMHPQVNLFSEATRDLDVLLKSNPENAEYESLFADCMMQAGRFAEASSYLTRSLNHDPGNVDGYYEQAWLLREKLNQPDNADAVIVKMLASNPKTYNSHLRAATYWHKYQQKDKYLVELARAKELAPNEPAVNYVVAELALSRSQQAAVAGDAATQKKEFDTAVALLIDSIQAATPTLPPLDPPPAQNSPEYRLLRTVAETYRMLVQSLIRTDRLVEAEDWARKAIVAFPLSMEMDLDLMDICIRREKFDEAEQLLARLDRGGFSTAILEFNRGRIAGFRGHWVEACRALEVAATELTGNPPLAREANLFLAKCYEQTGEIDRRYEAFRRAMPSDPTDPLYIPAVSGMAETLMLMGRMNEAEVEYKKIANRAPEAYLQMVRIAILDESRKDPASRNWKNPTELLEKLAASPGRELLRAELTANRDGLPATRPLLKKATDTYPKSVDLWLARLLLEIRLKDKEAATRIVDDATANLGDIPDIRLLRVQLALLNEPKVAAAELVKLTEGLDKYKVEFRLTLLRLMAVAVQRAERRDLARQWLEEVFKLRPNDLDLHYQRFDLALLDHDEEAIARILGDIAKTTGGMDSAPTRVAKAFHKLYLAQNGVDSALPEAEILLAGLEQHRTNWGRLYLAQARVADLQKKRDVATVKYRQAVDLGERNPEIISRLIEFYYDQQKYDDVKILMKSLPENGIFSLQNALVTHDYKKAMEMAEKMVPLTSTEPDPLLNLAQIYVLANKSALAEKPLRRVIEIAPDRPEAWLLLVQILVAADRKPEAESAIAEAKNKLKASEASLVLAQCYEVVGKPDLSRDLLKALLATNGNDLPTLRAASGFFFRDGDLATATPLYEQVINHPKKTTDDDATARRGLAICHASSRDYQTTLKAWDDLKLPAGGAVGDLTGRESMEDLRTRLALLLNSRGRQARLGAIRILDAINKQTPLSAEEHMLSGQLSTAIGDWTAGKRSMAIAAADPKAGRGTIAYFATVLIRNGELDDAKKQMGELAAKEPDSPRLAEIKARYAFASGKPAEAVSILEAFAGSGPGRTATAAALLEGMGLLEKAEPLYRKATDGTKAPEPRLALGAYLARTGRLTAALAEFDAVADQVKPEVMMPLLCDAVFQCGDRATSAEVASVVARVAAAAQKNPALQQHLAALKSVGGDHTEAIAICQEIVRREPNNAVALNNLAFLYALVQPPRHEAALDLLKRAKELVGPQPTLLDTEAVVLMAAGKPGDAIKLMNEVIVDDPSASSYFHLAQACLQDGNKTDAQIALMEAKKRNLRVGDFHPLEQPTVKNVLSRLAGVGGL